jgi:hypothetical protein
MSGLQSCVTSIQSSLPNFQQNNSQEKDAEGAVDVSELSDAQKFAVAELTLLLQEMSEWMNESAIEIETNDNDKDEKPLEIETTEEEGKEKDVDEKDTEMEKDIDSAQNPTDDSDEKEVKEDNKETDDDAVPPTSIIKAEEWKFKIVEMNNKLLDWANRIELIIERCAALLSPLYLSACIIASLLESLKRHIISDSIKSSLVVLQRNYIITEI